MINSGGIRSGIYGNITLADVLAIFPYENSIDILEFRGSTIRQILKTSAGMLTIEEQMRPPGGFLQVSGTFKELSQCAMLP